MFPSYSDLSGGLCGGLELATLPEGEGTIGASVGKRETVGSRKVCAIGR